MNTDLGLLKMLLLLSFWSPAGATKVSQQHYRTNNGSFCLEVATPPCHVNLDFAGTVVIFNNEARSAYKHRVDYDQKTFQWCLHQLNETDSGTYTLRIMKNDKVTSNSHVLVVEEAVPRPIIQLSKLSSDLSAELCNITVNCSVWDDWVLAVCNESDCQTSGRSLKTVNITVTVGNRSAICSGSNYVSTSNVSETICFSHWNGTSEEEAQLLYLLGTLIALALLLTPFLCFVFIKHRKDACPPPKTKPEESARAPSVSSRVSNLSSQSEAAYENVEAVPSEQARTVDTTYNLVEGQRGASEAREANNPAEVETVYSVLQKVENCRKDICESKEPWKPGK